MKKTFLIYVVCFLFITYACREENLILETFFFFFFFFIFSKTKITLTHSNQNQNLKTWTKTQTRKRQNRTTHISPEKNC